MENRNLNRKRIQRATNKIIQDNLEKNKTIDYKESVQLIADDCKLTNYEVLTYIKDLEDNDQVKFYSYKRNEVESVGFVTETYRLKLQEQLKIEETHFMESFINEALISDLCQ